jgi:plasmid stabilization system protein ParE
MYVVFILEEALEDLTTIVAHISAENVAAAETLGNELIDQAMSGCRQRYWAGHCNRFFGSGPGFGSAVFDLVVRHRW